MLQSIPIRGTVRPSIDLSICPFCLLIYPLREVFQSTFCLVSWPANDVLRVLIRFPRLPLRSPRVPIQSFGVFMKSHRVPWTFLKQLFGQDVPLRNQLVHLGGHFGCQKVTLGTAKITSSTWYIAWAPFEVARGLSEIPQGGWGFFPTLACSEDKVMKIRHARIFFYSSGFMQYLSFARVDFVQILMEW